jgi:hypothetical protein
LVIPALQDVGHLPGPVEQSIQLTFPRSTISPAGVVLCELLPHVVATVIVEPLAGFDPRIVRDPASPSSWLISARRTDRVEGLGSTVGSQRLNARSRAVRPCAVHHRRMSRCATPA